MEQGTLKNGKVVKRHSRIDLRASSEDEINLRKAATKLGTTKMTKVIFQSVKQVAEGTPDLFFCNRVAIRDVDNNINAGQRLLQVLVDEFTKVLPGVDVTVDEIASFYGKGRGDLMVPNRLAIREFLIDKLFDNQRNRYPGLKFTRENVELPDLGELMEAAGRLIEIPEISMRETGLFWNCYVISESKVLTLPDKIEEVKNQFRCYAETSEERARLSKVLELCEFMTGFAKDLPDPAKLNVPNVCYYDFESARFEPSEYYIKFSLK